MAFTNTNDFITGRAPVPTPAGGELSPSVSLCSGDRRPCAEHHRPDWRSAGWLRPCRPADHRCNGP